MSFKVCTCFLVFIGFIIFNPQTTLGAQQIPCFFSFGDSLVDNGNNNNLNTTSKANYRPYGIDFPDGPTGRFTNGRTIIDIVAQLLGFNDFIPPFATASGQEIIKGINYGSGGAGIRDETGKHRGDNLSFNKQMLNHRTTISRIASLIGNETSARKHLNKCLYSVMIGSNDYINNYYLPQNYNSSSKYTPDQYAAALIQQYLHQLMTLYNYGARKLVLFGLGPLGCIPTEISMFPTPTCVDSINDAVQLFNDRLKQLVEDLNTKLSQAKLIYINVSSIQFGAPASIAELVGLERDIPPFANTKRLSIMKGVNYYSSSGSGILDATGHELASTFQKFLAISHVSEGMGLRRPN
ncbi:GDSL esterase/lipase At1g29670-like [Coffea arabica]|uniref:GDSL esterase/lipase At1g29670-like n=1 Tax=Coffea arabica TaxID=13443 RepID=A0ABM4WU31_COFAR